VRDLCEYPPKVISRNQFGSSHGIRDIGITSDKRVPGNESPRSLCIHRTAGSPLIRRAPRKALQPAGRAENEILIFNFLPATRQTSNSRTRDPESLQPDRYRYPRPGHSRPYPRQQFPYPASSQTAHFPKTSSLTTQSPAQLPRKSIQPSAQCGLRPLQAGNARQWIATAASSQTTDFAKNQRIAFSLTTHRPAQRPPKPAQPSALSGFPPLQTRRFAAVDCSLGNSAPRESLGPNDQ
jgi:hypothetical protein